MARDENRVALMHRQSTDYTIWNWKGSTDSDSNRNQTLNGALPDTPTRQSDIGVSVTGWMFKDGQIFNRIHANYFHFSRTLQFHCTLRQRLTDVILCRLSVCHLYVYCDKMAGATITLLIDGKFDDEIWTIPCPKIRRSLKVKCSFSQSWLLLMVTSKVSLRHAMRVVALVTYRPRPTAYAYS